MRELSIVELDLIVGGYDETGGGDSFDESVFEDRATLNGDGSYSLEVTEAEYDANVAAAEADYWTIEIEGAIYDSDGIAIATVSVRKSSNAS